MKKVLCVLVMMIVLSSMSFADPIDEGYISLIFDNFDKYSEEEKIENAEILDVLFSSNMGLELLYNEIIRSRKASLEAYGVSEADLKRNIDALKTWSVEDRKALIAAGASGNKALVYDLNEKNSLVLKKTPFIQRERTANPELKKDFVDVRNHWSQDNVNFLAERGIISGKSQTSFAPEDNILKAEIVKLVMNLVIEDERQLPVYSGSIKDINTGAWYDDAMKQAYTLEIIKEDLENKLNPVTFATREEVVDIIIKSISSIGIDIDSELKKYTSTFKDYKNLSPQYRESMVIAINLGIIGGKGDNTIAPKALITRGETAAVVKRLYDFIINKI
jgi:hypothetical protein